LDDIRRRRIEGELRDLIAELILGGQVKDPRVGPFVSVTRVEAARDLSVARVFVSVFPEPEPEPAEGEAGSEARAEAEKRSRDRLELAVEGLGRAAGFIQSQLGKRMKTRLTPKLSFMADKGIQAGFELNERMKGLFQ
jgi:ribosome-binding factor A